MKVKFKNLIQAYSGKCDGLVYYYNRRLNRMCVREYVKPKKTAQNGIFAAISTNLKALNLSAAYKQDLKDYANLYMSRREKDRKAISNWYNIFMMLMYAMAEQYSIDLRTISRTQIYEQELPCISVKDAVVAGLLPVVRNYDRLDNPL
ncbi:MAG: hypothetical protein R6V77_07685 [Candidatus Cloacimonadaceae bacterium]